MMKSISSWAGRPWRALCICWHAEQPIELEVVRVVERTARLFFFHLGSLRTIRLLGSETHPQFHRRPVPAALLGTVPSGRRPGDGAGHRRDRGKRPRGRRCRRRRGVPRVRVVAPDARRRTIPAPDPGGRAHRGELRRAGAARIGRQREADRARPADGHAPGHPELSLLCDGDPARRNARPHDGRSGAQLHPPAAPRRRRADLTLEPAAVPSDLEDRSGHRRRELLRGEAFGADAADRRPARRADPGGGHSARRRQHRARPRRRAPAAPSRRIRTSRSSRSPAERRRART